MKLCCYDITISLCKTKLFYKFRKTVLNSNTTQYCKCGIVALISSILYYAFVVGQPLPSSNTSKISLLSYAAIKYHQSLYFNPYIGISQLEYNPNTLIPILTFGVSMYRMPRWAPGNSSARIKNIVIII